MAFSHAAPKIMEFHATQLWAEHFQIKNQNISF